MLFCEYFDKALKKQHCPFSKICKEKCQFVLEDLDIDIRQLLNKIEDLECDLEELQDDFDKLEEENDDLCSSNNNLQEDLEEAMSHISQLEAYIQDNYEPDFNSDTCLLDYSYQNLRENNSILLKELMKYKEKFGDLK